MTLLEDSPGATAPSITALDPRDGTPIASYPVMGPDAVAATVHRARAAATWWAQLGPDGRKRVLLRWKAAIANDAASLAAVISRETGKPSGDALLEVMLTLGHLDWAAKNAGSVLKRRKVHAGLMNYNQRATLGYEPHGVVGVIGPWNYPFYTPMGSISYALAAGNAIVFKPSELTPGTAAWIAEKWTKVCDKPVLQVVTGDGSTGVELVRAGIDKVAFTGSTRTAKKVMALCAESLTPLVAECGGKDALIVAADADLDSAADFIVFGAMGNAGQTCVGVERVYVEKAVSKALVGKVVERTKRLRVGGADATYGPMTLPSQTAVVRTHVQDALDRGGSALIGGTESIGDRYAEPVVLVDVPEDSAAVREETFGPTVVINTVANLDEAVRLANASEYGLGAAVFTKSGRTGQKVAAQLQAGVVTINSVLGFASIPTLPFGGVKGSGFGRIHGADGLREFSVAKSIAHQKGKAALNLLTVERSEKDMHMVAKMLPMLHGKAK